MTQQLRSSFSLSQNIWHTWLYSRLPILLRSPQCSAASRRHAKNLTSRNVAIDRDDVRKEWSAKENSRLTLMLPVLGKPTLFFFFFLLSHELRGERCEWLRIPSNDFHGFKMPPVASLRSDHLVPGCEHSRKRKKEEAWEPFLVHQSAFHIFFYQL